MRRLRLIATAALLALAPASAPGQSALGPRPVSFERYHAYAELVAALRALNRAYPSRTRLRSMGRSYEGRELWLLTVFNPATGKEKDKAAIYVDGNAHGNELQGAEAILYLAQHLLSRYSESPAVRRLVDERVFYLAPCINPDGREAFLTSPNSPHSSRRNRRPVDDDQDGLTDEDGLDDIDGDGRILLMRKRDPLGDYKPGADPRIMVRCKPGELGSYRLLGWEGIDNDGDGRLNEDGPGGVDLNRNFPSSWRPRHIQAGAGDYPLSEPETRAVASFLEEHPNIAAIQSFHNDGGLILRPPGAKSEREIPAADRRIYDAMGARGERTLPGYRYLLASRDLYPAHGAFLDWGYLGLGVLSFSNELFVMPRDHDKDGEVSEAERLRWSDEMLDGAGFQSWYPVSHPRYGAIELGGWNKLARRMPPTWLLAEECHRNARFVMYHASMMPRVAVASTRVRRAPGGELVFRIEAVFENRGFMPTSTARARSIKVAVKDRLEIRGAEIKVLSAALQTDLDQGRSELVDTRRPERVLVEGIPGRGRVKATWLVSGRGRVVVTITSEKGGSATEVLNFE